MYVYLSQKMTFLDGCTQLCTQLAENWKMVVFGQKMGIFNKEHRLEFNFIQDNITDVEAVVIEE